MHAFALATLSHTVTMRLLPAEHSAQGHERFAQSMAALMPKQEWQDAQRPAAEQMHAHLCQSFVTVMDAFANQATPLWVAPCTAAAAAPADASSLSAAEASAVQQEAEDLERQLEDLSRQEADWQARVSDAEQRAAALQPRPAVNAILGDPGVIENVQDLSNKVAESSRAMKEYQELRETPRPGASGKATKRVAAAGPVLGERPLDTDELLQRIL
jgi:hypothetical protein